MRKTGEWGQFFPIDHSPFPYNESVAQDYFPITKEEATAQGLWWREERDETTEVPRVIRAGELPSKIEDVSDDILSCAVECPVTKRSFLNGF